MLLNEVRKEHKRFEDLQAQVQTMRRELATLEHERAVLLSPK
jgi:hypothetical protein